MSADKCPACGSESVGIAETFGGGAHRFKPVCAKCRWTTVDGWTSIQEAFDKNRHFFSQWDRGIVMVEGWDVKFDDTVKMVSGDKRPPSVGELRLDGIARVTDAEVRTDVFRDATEEARFEAGQPTVKMFICEGCRASQGGAEIKGSFYAVPAGWYLQHPSARLFCSVDCVTKERNAGDG